MVKIDIDCVEAWLIVNKRNREGDESKAGKISNKRVYRNR